nr:hypothetical protein [Tanacetum cinerariifolium]
MGFNLFHVTLFSLALVGSHAVTPEVYWKSVLPNSPMPQSVKELLYTTEWNDEKNTAVDVGKGGVGVHTGKADSIPFSLKNLPEIYTEFEVKPESTEAKIMKQTLAECENKGKNVKAISTEVNTKESTPLQKYKIEVAKKLAANKAVVCHKQNYAYAVFYCHKTVSTRAYTVFLAGADGTKVKAVAVCHTDTAKWNPKHLAFQVLKVKPGSVPVCHFLPEDHVVWVPY